MVHELLIEFDFELESPLKRFLSPNELIRSEIVKLTMFVTNLSTEVFPGGKVLEWRISY